MLTLLWLVLNHKDTHSKNYPYFKQKIWFFILIFLLISIELILQILFLTNISTASPVLCCSAIYKDESNQLPFNLSNTILITLFYIVTIATIIFAYFKKRLALFGFSIIHLFISYYAIAYFFATYVYELPSHKCPFCLLQSDYYFIGYFIYGSLFTALFYALSAAIFKFSNQNFKRAMVWYVLFTLACSFSYIIYIIKNHTFL